MNRPFVLDGEVGPVRCQSLVIKFASILSCPLCFHAYVLRGTDVHMFLLQVSHGVPTNIIDIYIYAVGSITWPS